jgi:hypothetical protein
MRRRFYRYSRIHATRPSKLVFRLSISPSGHACCQRLGVVISPINSFSPPSLLRRPFTDNINAQSTSMAGEDMASEDYPSYSPLYLAFLRTAKNLLNNSMDLWSNVKIPDIDSLSASTTLLRDGWHEIDTSGFVSFTSLLGIPTVGGPTEGNSSYELASRYYKVDCPNVTWTPTTLAGISIGPRHRG